MPDRRRGLSRNRNSVTQNWLLCHEENSRMLSRSKAEHLFQGRKDTMTTQTWNIDTSHSGVHFTVRHMVVSKVRGAFTKWTAELAFDEENPAASKVTASIDAASIDTREPRRDAHLRSVDFFDVENHPALT